MDKFFKLKENGTNVKTEIIAGITTFLTMAYIISVNPSILSVAMGLGLDGAAKLDMFNSILVATILAAIVGTLIMGLVANVPFALAPGMGLNAFFTYTVCLGMGISWQTALGVVFICGVFSIIITLTKIRKMLLVAVPKTLQHAIGGGIGLFIAYIGFKNAHILDFTVEPFNWVDKANGVAKDVIPSIVNFQDPVTLVALIGLIVTIILMLRKVKGAMLMGIVAATVAGIFIGGLTKMGAGGITFAIPSVEPTFLKLDLSWLIDPIQVVKLLPIVLAFILSDTFDTLGAFLGTGKRAGIFDKKDEAALESGKGMHSKLEKALFADASATATGALFGTSNTTVYIESAAGISEGGRTGLTSVVVALLFMLCLPLSSIIGLVPLAATAPALIVVGILMMAPMKDLQWDNFEEAVAAFFIVVVMPFTFSIANGIAIGFMFYVITKVVMGKAKDVHLIMYIVTILFVLEFVLKALGIIQ